MRNIVGLNVLCLVLGIGLVLEPVLSAQQGAPPDAPSAGQSTAAQSSSAQSSTPQSSAPEVISSGAHPNVPLADVSVPVPTQIRAAKTIFIANAGDKTNLFPDVYSGGPDRPYVQFYADMQSWGHYQLVSSPEKADLIFEIELVNPIASELLPGNNAGYWNGAEWHDPQLRLSIVDPKSRISLWELTSHIQSTMRLKKSRDKQFDLAMQNLVAEVQQLTTRTATTESSSLLTEKGHSRSIKIMAIVAVAAAAAGVASFAVIASQNNRLPTLPPPTFPPAAR